MLLKQLSTADRRLFLRVAELVALADKPFSGATVVRTDSGQFQGTQSSIQIPVRTKAALEELVSMLQDAAASPQSPDVEYKSMSDKLRSWFGIGPATPDIVTRLRSLPATEVDLPAARTSAALEILREILKDQHAAVPSVPKLILYELTLLAMAEGNISVVQWDLLNAFKHHFHVEDHVFEDLTERALSAYQEGQKTLAIILE